MRSRAQLFVAALVASPLVLFGVLGCQTAEPTDTPGVERLGQWVLRYSGEDLILVLTYRFAASQPEAEWLIVEVAASAPYGRSTVIRRDAILVESPDGTRIPLATQAEYASDYGSVMAAAARSAVVTDPLDYFPHSRRDCEFEFFARPGEAITFSEVTVDDIRACRGKLFFKVPQGIASGRWTLVVALPDSEVRVPFEL